MTESQRVKVAGAELDAEVARQVMRWRVHCRNTAWWVDAQHENGPIPPHGVRGMTCGMDRWSPSTDIAVAWQVVEKMREVLRTDAWKPYPDKRCDQGPWFSVEAPDDSIHHDCPARGKWCAGLRENTHFEGDGWVIDRYALADTAPLAVCLAALRCCGVDA
jgi:hypothetical protein